MNDEQVSVSRTIKASPEDIFDVLAHPARHSEIDGSGTVKASRGGADERLSQGAKFGMDMRIGLPYIIKNTVVEFEEGRRALRSPHLALRTAANRRRHAGDRDLRLVQGSDQGVHHHDEVAREAHQEHDRHT